MEMPNFDPNRPLTGTLAAQEWDTLLTAAQIGMNSILSRLAAQLNQQPLQMTTEEVAAQVVVSGSKPETALEKMHKAR
jgi:hypothetical protein